MKKYLILLLSISGLLTSCNGNAKKTTTPNWTALDTIVLNNVAFSSFLSLVETSGLGQQVLYFTGQINVDASIGGLDYTPIYRYNLSSTPMSDGNYKRETAAAIPAFDNHGDKAFLKTPQLQIHDNYLYASGFYKSIDLLDDGSESDVVTIQHCGHAGLNVLGNCIGTLFSSLTFDSGSVIVAKALQDPKGHEFYSLVISKESGGAKYSVKLFNVENFNNAADGEAPSFNQTPMLSNSTQLTYQDAVVDNNDNLWMLFATNDMLYMIRYQLNPSSNDAVYMKTYDVINSNMATPTIFGTQNGASITINPDNGLIYVSTGVNQDTKLQSYVFNANKDQFVLYQSVLNTANASSTSDIATAITTSAWYNQKLWASGINVDNNFTKGIPDVFTINNNQIFNYTLSFPSSIFPSGCFSPKLYSTSSGLFAASECSNVFSQYDGIVLQWLH